MTRRKIGDAMKHYDSPQPTVTAPVKVQFSVRGDRSEIEHTIARVRNALGVGVAENDIPKALGISPEDAFLAIHAARILDRP